MKRVLITGAAGFIGFALAVEIRRRFPSCELWLADDFSRGVRDHVYGEFISSSPGVIEIDGNLCDPNTVARLPSGCDHVFHFAALNGTGNFYDRPFDVVRSSTVPTVLLLEKLAGEKSLQRFVYAGSSEAYAGAIEECGYAVPTSEDVPLVISDVRNPRWSYGGSKLHGEVATVAAGSQFGMPVTCLRFHNVYGPRMGDKHVVPDFYMRLRSGIASLYGGDNTRSFMYIKDAVDAVFAVIDYMPRDEVELVNIGSDDEITMRSLATHMLAAVDETDREVEVYPAPTGSVSRRCPDIGRLRRHYGFKPAFELKKGLERAAAWYFHDHDNVSDGRWLRPA